MPRTSGRGEDVTAELAGREPFRSAAFALLRESGCTVSRWRSRTTGVACVDDPDWAIEVPQPRGPVSYGTFAHEVGHQMLHRYARTKPRWREELEAWRFALDTFDRFGLPGLADARRDAVRSLARAVEKAVRRGAKPGPILDELGDLSMEVHMEIVKRAIIEEPS